MYVSLLIIQYWNAQLYKLILPNKIPQILKKVNFYIFLNLI